MQGQNLSILAAEKNKQHIVQAVKNYSRQLFGFIRKNVGTDADAEDILQEVWYQYANSSATQTIEQVGAWLYKVARNKITDKHRRRTERSLEDYAYEDENGIVQLRELLYVINNDPELEDMKRLFWEELFATLYGLPENQREVFLLNELEDMTLQEIADLTGENLKTVISRKRYAVQHLRKRMEYLYTELINY